MLDEVKPDAVLATVPNAEHLAVTRACAERRIHLWFQKPMAATAPQAREMARLARDANILLMLSFHNLFNAPMQAVTASIEAGQIGAIERLVMRNAFNASKVLSPTYSAQFLDPARHGGGALMDQGTYGINYAVYLLGRPARVMATAKTLHPRAGLSMEDEVWVVLDYPKATALINGGWWAHPDIGSGTGELNVSGTKGVIVRQGNSTTMQQATDPMPRALSIAPISHEMSGGVAHFIYSIRNHKPVHRAHGPEVNLIVAEIVDAAYESIRTGRAITLP
jgi:predicted dehydrogenase